MELFIVPLYKSCLERRKLSECNRLGGAGRGGRGWGRHTVKRDAAYSTTTPCDQVWEDVTAESQAVFQPERNELPL